jgi:Rrf2 family protein
MWVSRKTDYATRAVLALAIAGGGTLKMDELAARVQAPPSMLEQILPVLRSGGILRSVRGPRGGYTLNHDPADITMERVVRLFEGQLAPISCATRKNPEPCPMDDGCSLRDVVWEPVRDAVLDILGRTDFATLAARAGGVWVDPPPAGPPRDPGAFPP